MEFHTLPGPSSADLTIKQTSKPLPNTSRAAQSPWSPASLDWDTLFMLPCKQKLQLGFELGNWVPVEPLGEGDVFNILIALEF